MVGAAPLPRFLLLEQAALGCTDPCGFWWWCVAHQQHTTLYPSMQDHSAACSPQSPVQDLLVTRSLPTSPCPHHVGSAADPASQQWHAAPSHPSCRILWWRTACFPHIGSVGGILPLVLCHAGCLGGSPQDPQGIH